MKYDAFISYSHTDCGNIAPAIQRALENIGKPWYRLKRNLTVFRDETNLAASPELWNSIVAALDNSDNLILLASPIAKDSFWVNKEIEHWFSKERTGKLYIVLSQGEIIWNYNANDFYWEKTNCLPLTLRNRFNEEPLWIDLTNYHDLESKTVNYKEAGFTSSLTKVIGGILGKPPREIESDELSRKKRTTFALVLSSIAFISLSFIGILLYIQSKQNKRFSIANNLIAEGNKNRESNINKSLLLYAYAYSINEDSATYSIVNEFYKQNQVVSDTLTLFINDSINSNVVDTLNTFYKVIKKSENSINPDNNYPDGNTENWVNEVISEQDESIYYRRLYLSVKGNCFFYLDRNKVYFNNLSTQKIIDSLIIQKDEIIDIVSDLESEELNFLISNSEYTPNEIIQYNCINNTKKVIQLTKNRRHFDNYTGNKYMMANNSKSLFYLLSPLGWDHATENLEIIDVRKNKSTFYSLKFNNIFDPNFHIIELIPSNKSLFTFIKVQGGSEGFQVDLIANVKNGKTFLLSKGASRNLGKWKKLVSQFRWGENDEYFVYTTNDGIIHYVDSVVMASGISFEQNYERSIDDDLENIESISLNTDITALLVTPRYIFVSYSDNNLTCYLNPRCLMTLSDLSRIQFIKLFDMRLDIKENVGELQYIEGENKLVILTISGEILEMKLKNHIELSKNPYKVLEQILSNLGIDDLSRQEKRRLNLLK